MCADSKMRRPITKIPAHERHLCKQTKCITPDSNLVVVEFFFYNLPRISYTRGNDLSGSLQGAGGIGGLI